MFQLKEPGFQLRYTNMSKKMSLRPIQCRQLCSKQEIEEVRFIRNTGFPSWMLQIKHL